MHNRIHDLVIDLAVQVYVSGPGTAHQVCAEFLGLAIGTGWGGNTVVLARTIQQT